jgi:hypothetical protein
MKTEVHMPEDFKNDKSDMMRVTLPFLQENAYNDVYFYDDKEDNLNAVRNFIEENSDIQFSPVHVNDIKSDLTLCSKNDLINYQIKNKDSVLPGIAGIISTSGSGAVIGGILGSIFIPIPGGAGIGALLGGTSIGIGWFAGSKSRKTQNYLEQKSFNGNNTTSIIQRLDEGGNYVRDVRENFKQEYNELLDAIQRNDLHSFLRDEAEYLATNSLNTNYNLKR